MQRTPDEITANASQGCGTEAEVIARLAAWVWGLEIRVEEQREVIELLRQQLKDAFNR